MKVIQIILTIFIAVFAAVPLSGGQDQSALSEALQRGLVAEEVKRDLPAAIAAYEAAVAQFDQDRDLAATAIFRLAETYRRVDRVPEAEALYQRLVREFPDQTELARLAAERLPEGQTDTSAVGAESSEFSPVTIRIQTEEGRPLAGFRVEMESGEGRRVFASGESDASGLALARNLPYGEYELRVIRPWKTTFRKVMVEFGAPSEKIIYAPDPDGRARVRIRSAIEQEEFAGLKFGFPERHFLGSAEVSEFIANLPELGNGIEQIAFRIGVDTLRTVIQPDGSRQRWFWAEEGLHDWFLAKDAAWTVQSLSGEISSIVANAERYFGGRIPVPYRNFSLKWLESSEVDVEMPAGEVGLVIHGIFGKPDVDVLEAMGLKPVSKAWLPAAVNESSTWQNRVIEGFDWDSQDASGVHPLTLEAGETREIVLRAPEADVEP